MVRKLVLFFVLFLVPVSFCFSEIYDFGDSEKEGESVYKNKSFAKLRLKEMPASPLPVFLYEIKKIKNPHTVPQKVFNESVFLLQRGNLYFSKKDYSRAIEFYKKALSVNSSFLLAYHNMGVAYFLLGEYEKSRNVFKQVLKKKVLNGEAYFYLGWIYKRLENFRAAEDYLKSAKQIFKSEDKILFIRRADALLKKLPEFPYR